MQHRPKYTPVILFSLLLLGSSVVVGQGRVVRETHYQDWVLRCYEDSQCYTMQKVTTGAGSLSIIVGKFRNQKELDIRFTLPFGIYLPAGMSFDIDGNQKTMLPITTCLEDGCKAESKLSDYVQRLLRDGNQLNLSFMDHTTREVVPVAISLKGFPMGMAGI